jgi:hypothetical protein
MRWISVTHSSGSELINVEQLYRITAVSTSNIAFYPVGSSTPTTLTFASLIERNEILEKFQKILDSLNINRIATQ